MNWRTQTQIITEQTIKHISNASQIVITKYIYISINIQCTQVYVPMYICMCIVYIESVCNSKTELFVQS